MAGGAGRLERHGAAGRRRARVGAPSGSTVGRADAPVSRRAARRRPRSRAPPPLRAAWLLGVFKLGTYWSCYTWLPTFLSHGMHQSVGRSLTWMVTAQVGQLGGMLSFGAIPTGSGGGQRSRSIRC